MKTPKTLLIPKVSGISAPDSDHVAVYAKSDNKVYGQSSTGAEFNLSVEDPILSQHGVPATAYEFDSTTVPGTLIGTPTAEDANTSIIGCYYVRKANSASTDFTGRYVASPATPFTIVTKIVAYLPVVPLTTFDFAHIGCCGIAEAVPGKLEFIQYVCVTSAWNVYHTQIASPTGAVTNITNSVSAPPPQFYFAVRVNSATSVDFLVSHNGRTWKALSTARNPLFTIGSICWGAFPESAANFVASAFEYIRVFGSALTLVS